MIWSVLFACVAGHDRYYEGIQETPVSASHRLVSFRFSIETDGTDSQLLDLFPQPVASVLIANRISMKSFSGHLVRGRWKWASNTPSFHPTGSSMFVTGNHSDRGVWTQTAWMLSTILGASFESLAPEQKSFYWMTPLDLDGGVRVASNPNEHLCTDNVERWTELLPCRHRRGLGQTATAISLEMARSEYISIHVEGRNTKDNGSILNGAIHVVLENGIKLLDFSPCLNRSSINEQIGKTQQSVSVFRSMTGSSLGPERRYGQLRYVLVNTDLSNPHWIEIQDQIPFFLVPLWHRYAHENLPDMEFPTSETAPTNLKWELKLDPGETRSISLDVYKRYIPMSRFSFSFEKGFDIGSAAYRIDRGEWSLTRGLVVIIPLPDATSTFNAIAVSMTTIALFYGIVFRAFVGKRSELLDETKTRDPPIIRLVTWIYERIKSRRL
jgi:hypothetical protein